MRVIERVAAIREAKAHMDRLTSNANVSRNTLGRGRDLLNQSHNVAKRDDVWQAVTSLRALADRHQH